MNGSNMRKVQTSSTKIKPPNKINISDPLPPEQRAKTFSKILNPAPPSQAGGLRVFMVVFAVV